MHIGCLPINCVRCWHWCSDIGRFNWLPRRYFMFWWLGFLIIYCISYNIVWCSRDVLLMIIRCAIWYVSECLYLVSDLVSVRWWNLSLTFSAYHSECWISADVSCQGLRICRLRFIYLVLVGLAHHLIIVLYCRSRHRILVKSLRQQTRIRKVCLTLGSWR